MLYPKMTIVALDNGYTAEFYTPAEGPDLEMTEKLVFTTLPDCFEHARMLWEPKGERLVHPVPSQPAKEPAKKAKKSSSRSVPLDTSGEMVL